jgi:hypothetical protein
LPSKRKAFLPPQARLIASLPRRSGGAGDARATALGSRETPSDRSAARPAFERIALRGLQFWADPIRKVCRFSDSWFTGA